MKAQCPHCNAVYTINESRIPEGGAALRCKRCLNKFRIKRPIEYLGIVEERTEDTKKEESVAKAEQKGEEISERPKEADSNVDDTITRIERPIEYLGIVEERTEDTKKEESVAKAEQKGEEISERPKEANSNVDDILTRKDETTKKTGFLDRAFSKLADGLGITSGHGLIALGILWFIYCIYMYLTISPGGTMQVMTHENFINQAVMGVIIVGIGAILKKIK